jgi:protein ImuB
MRHWIGVHLPRLPIESFCPTWYTPVSQARFVVLDKGRVIDMDSGARAHGVVKGMRRGGVLTLAPDADLRERDSAREQQTVLGVAFALLQFSPHVLTVDENVVLADVTASLRLFHALRALRRRMLRTVADFGVTCAASVAPTAEAAWLLARAGGGIALGPRSLTRAFTRIPLNALPTARRFAGWFDGLGCTTINDVMRLPRAGLKKRCGTALLDALDRATGAAPEAHEWLVMPPAFEARVELPDRIEHVEAALFAARRLTLQMTGWLSARQLAVAHERGRAAIAPTEIEIALGEPTWHEEHLVRLLKERLARRTRRAAYCTQARGEGCACGRGAKRFALSRTGRHAAGARTPHGVAHGAPGRRKRAACKPGRRLPARGGRTMDSSQQRREVSAHGLAV